MRVWSFVAAAAIRHDVRLFVIPVAGATGVSVGLPPGVIRHDLAPRRTDRPGDVVQWFAEPVWRDRLPLLDPVYPTVRMAPPAMAADVLAALSQTRPSGVLACRLGLAPLGLSVAERLNVALLIDADDDDVELHRSRGEPELAAAAARTAAMCFPLAALVTAANPADVERLRRRHQLRHRMDLVPNSVRLPASSSLTPPPGRGKIVFVGNLTYGPNIDAVRWLVEEVLPLLPRRHVVCLVGEPAAEVRALAGDRVRVLGAVTDVSPAYADADVAVVPLLSGSGTRIKVLEAFAHRRPVVSTTQGACGTGAVNGVHLALADTPREFAAAVQRLCQPDVAGPLVEAARALVARSFDATIVRNGIDLLLGRATEPTVGSRA
jgi:glycosyltransferase involved in cell wall biosynthesis